jgi:DNA-binding CsgD family transcriptional regulator
MAKQRTPVLGAKAKKRAPVPNQKAQTIEERREQVFRLRIRGIARKDIAEQLNVSLGTVKNDLAIMRQKNAEYVTEYQQNEFVGMSIAMFEEVATNAWEEYDNNKANGTLRLKALDLVRNITKDQIKLLQEVGLLKAKEKGLDDDDDEALKGFLDGIPKNIRKGLIKDTIKAALPTDLEEPTLSEVAKQDDEELEEWDDEEDDLDSLDDFDEDEFEDDDEELEGWDEEDEWE